MEDLLVMAKRHTRSLEHLKSVVYSMAGKKIEVEYIPSETKANYRYYWSGIENRGWRRLFNKYAVAPTYGVQFDPMGNYNE